MEIITGIKRQKIIILLNTLTKGRSEKVIFGPLERAYTLPLGKTSYIIPVPKEKHEDE